MLSSQQIVSRYGESFDPSGVSICSGSGQQRVGLCMVYAA